MRARRAVPPVPGSSACWWRPRRPPTAAPPRSSRGRARRCSRASPASSPSLGIARVHVLTRPAWADAIARRRRRRARCTRARAADDLRAIGRIAAERGGPARGRLRRHRHPARGAGRPARRAAASAPACSPPAATPRARSASRPARAAGASSRPARPTTPCARPTGTFLGVLKVAPADRPGVAPVAERLAALVEPRRRADWQEELDYKAGHWHRMLALFSLDRERGEPAPPREELDAVAAHARGRRRARAPARDRAGRRRPRCCSSAHALRRARRRLAPALAVLGPPRLAGRARSAPRPRSSSTTRTASCSTRRSRARTASSPRSSSRPTRSTSPAGRRAGG